MIKKSKNLLKRFIKLGTKYKGHIDDFDCEIKTVYGWIYDKNENSTNFYLIINDKVTNIQTADIFRKDLKQKNIGSGHHGFEVNIDNFEIPNDSLEIRLIHANSNSKVDSKTFIAKRNTIPNSYNNELLNHKNIGINKIEAQLFDAIYYKSQLDPVYKNANEKRLITHYISKGWKENLNPHILFNTSLYVKYNEDIKFELINPLKHYIKYGFYEGRHAFTIFDDPEDASLLKFARLHSNNIDLINSTYIKYFFNLETLDLYSISGWAFTNENLTKNISLSLFYKDKFIYSFSTFIHRKDLKKIGLKNSFGFYEDLREIFKNEGIISQEQLKKIKIKITNSNYMLRI